MVSVDSFYKLGKSLMNREALATMSPDPAIAPFTVSDPESAREYFELLAVNAVPFDENMYLIAKTLVDSHTYLPKAIASRTCPEDPSIEA